jgi:hypothetical protein
MSFLEFVQGSPIESPEGDESGHRGLSGSLKGWMGFRLASQQQIAPGTAKATRMAIVMATAVMA